MSLSSNCWFVSALVLGLSARAAADVQVPQTADDVTLSNGTTTLSARIQDGGANAFDLIDAHSGHVLAQIEIGGLGRWRAACSAKSDGQVGIMTFRDIDTTATGGTPVFHDSSEIRVELAPSHPFPLVRFRLNVTDFKRAVWQKSVGGRVPVHFLSCRMDDAQFFYRGGFHMPSPAVDAFPIRSRSMRGDWDGLWSYPAALGACPVPAVGLWSTAGSRFVGYEFHEARSTDKSSKQIVSAYCAGLPKEPRQFVTLLLDDAVQATSRFRLLYNTELPANASPNGFVLRHLWKAYQDRLPAAPTTNDLGWLPRRDHFLSDDRTSATLLHRVRKNSPDELMTLFTDNTLLPDGDYRGTLNLLMAGKGARQNRLLQEWELLRGKAIRKRIGEDDCVSWRFPVQGDYEEAMGGQGASDNSPATWRVGAALLAMYRTRKDAALLNEIDGIFRWTRHSAFTRAGDPALPAAASIASAEPGAVEFLLNVHHLFHNHPDAERQVMAAEALTLGRTVLDRCLALYTDDPDETDNVEPTFLIQANSARNSAGSVSWKDTQRLIRAIVFYYVETGDPLLEYLARGALQHYPLGVESDGVHTIETLDAFGIGTGTKGRRLGLLDPDGAFAESLQPVGAARLRVLCGRKAAFAVSSDARANVYGYQFTESGEIRFNIVADTPGPFDINVTSAFRDLRDKTIVVNGKTVEAEVVGRHGENAVIRSVTASTLAEAEPRELRSGSDGATLVTLPCNSVLDRSWGNGLSWAGLADGVRFAWGVPFRIAAGASKAVDLTKGPVTLKPTGPFASVFLFVASTPNAPTVRISYADGKTEQRRLERHLPALEAGPIRRWRIDMYPVPLQSAGARVAKIEVSGDTLLFAVTTCAGRNAAFESALAKAEARRMSREAEVTAARRLAQSMQRIVPDTRAAVAAVTRGKTLRIGLIPPHEAYTDVLRKACSTLGVPPVLLSPQEIVDPSRFTPKRYPIVVYSSGETYLHTVTKPGDAAEALKAYVAAGGCLVVAAQGYPFFYAMRFQNGRFERIEGTRNGETCATLEIPITFGPVPPLEQIPMFELVPGQKAFQHLPARLKYSRHVGVNYRPMARQGFAAEDLFEPFLLLKDGSGGEHGVVAAVVEHHCPTYKGGRTIFLWGNVLAMEQGPTIALDLMRYAICTAKLQPAPTLEPRVAILPRDMAGHERAIQRACSGVGLKTQILTAEQFADPALFNPGNFPIAIHAVGGEYFLDQCAGRSNAWQVYTDYVKGGGFLVACGNMSQFFYAGTLSADGKWQQQYDPAQSVTAELGLQVVNSRIHAPPKMLLKCLPGQDIVKFESPLPLDYLHWGYYRAVAASDMLGTEFLPLAEVTDGEGQALGGHVMGIMRYNSRELRGAEMLWLWGDLLNDARAHPLLDQAVKYAHERRHAMFELPTQTTTP